MIKNIQPPTNCLMSPGKAESVMTELIQPNYIYIVSSGIQRKSIKHNKKRDELYKRLSHIYFSRLGFPLKIKPSVVTGGGGGKSITAKIVSLQKSERGGERGPFHASRAPIRQRSSTDGARALVILYVRIYALHSYVRSRNVLYSSRFLPLYYTRNWFIADRRRQRDAPVGVMVIIINIIYTFTFSQCVLNRTRITRGTRTAGKVCEGAQAEKTMMISRCRHEYE